MDEVFLVGPVRQGKRMFHKLVFIKEVSTYVTICGHVSHASPLGNGEKVNCKSCKDLIKRGIR